MSNTYINYTFESKVDWVKKINECQKEIERLNNDIKELLKENGNKEKVIKAQDNIINDLEKWLNDLTILKTDKFGEARFYDMVKIQAVLNKLQELKGSDKE